MKKVDEAFIESILEKMTTRQKVGGLMVVDFMGTIPTPYTIKLIRDFHVAGLRVDTSSRGKASYAEGTDDPGLIKKFEQTHKKPTGCCFDFVADIKAPVCSPADYAATLNELRDVALERPLGIPIHTTLDQEGNGSENYSLQNTRLFPPPMGLAATNDPQLVYKASDAIAKQLRAVGINWIHSPVLDVNVEHKNFEVATRAYSDSADVISRYALETLRAFGDNDLIATGKHFPGRGDSTADAHLECAVLPLSRQKLMDIHLAPYIELIKEGLPAIMIAHSVYPALDDSGVPATMSYEIVTKLLREELGFNGVVTTDNMLMGGIVSKYGVPDACVGAIAAGQDLLLLRSQTPLCEEVFHTLMDAVESGRISKKRLDDANRNVLTLKYKYGLFDNGGKVDPEKAHEASLSKEIINLEKDVARKAVVVRDEKSLLPLSKDSRVLLVEQVHFTHLTLNNVQCYPSVFWHKLRTVAPGAMSVEVTGQYENDLERVMRRIDEADVIITTNYVARRSNRDMSALVRELMKTGKPVVVVTNSPFEFGSPKDLPTVVNVFSANPESLLAASEVIFGGLKAQGVLPLAQGGERL